MKAAIIGADSYIARNLIRINQAYGYADTALYGRREKHADHVEGYRKIDPNRQEELEKAVSDCDVIYFFVGKVGTIQGFDNPDDFLDTNEKLLFRLLNACRAVGTKGKIVFPSTRLVYQGNESAVTEVAEKQFLTPYAMQKYACEQYLGMYRHMYGIRYCVLRIGVPYGTLVQPVSSYGTLDFFLKQARDNRQISIYGDGKQRRTFTYIGDLCHILWRAGLDPNCVNDVYNVGGEDLSIGAVAEQVAAATGATVVRRPWPAEALKVESGSTVFDSQKLDGLLRYEPTVTVEQWVADGLRKGKQEMTNEAASRIIPKNGNGGGVRSST